MFLFVTFDVCICTMEAVGSSCHCFSMETWLLCDQKKSCSTAVARGEKVGLETTHPVNIAFFIEVNVTLALHACMVYYLFASMWNPVTDTKPQPNENRSRLNVYREIMSNMSSGIWQSMEN